MKRSIKKWLGWTVGTVLALAAVGASAQEYFTIEQVREQAAAGWHGVYQAYGREITVELRSVNNRFLDCSVRLPRAFSYAEDALKQSVKEFVSRGKVDMFVTVNVTAEENVRISLNRPVLEGYLEALRTIAKDYDVREDITATARL